MQHNKTRNILVIHGPNLNMLGRREPEIYGNTTLEDVNRCLKKAGDSMGISVETFQSNHEGEIVEKIQQAVSACSGLIINPAAFTHTSVAIRDALLLLDIPIIEIHISNIHKREPFRHTSMIADISVAQLAGFGINGYLMALDAMAKMLG
jgi:3-dehydroquinate dehydratase-2